MSLFIGIMLSLTSVSPNAMMFLRVRNVHQMLVQPFLDYNLPHG